MPYPLQPVTREFVMMIFTQLLIWPVIHSKVAVEPKDQVALTPKRSVVVIVELKMNVMPSKEIMDKRDVGHSPQLLPRLV